MAKLLCLVALLEVASAIVAEVHEPAPSPAKAAAAPVPAPAPSHSVIRKHPTFSLKCIIHNLAERVVTFRPVIHVTVKNHKGVAVTKSFPVKLAAFLKDICSKSSKALVVTVTETKSYRRFKKLVVKVYRKELLVMMP